MKNIIELNDFYSAAYLIAAGYEMKDIYRVSNQSTFVFEGTPEAKSALGDYYAMDAMVNASTYAQEIKKLKNIIHNTYAKPGNNTYARKEKIFDISQG
ncbi:MAG: hypothetical protein KAU44_01560 [Candidatus Marinimicrobia bacterium]|nr:hypothetical protein [Candidatus Neomarinimicrobiota bacterium]